MLVLTFAAVTGQPQPDPVQLMEKGRDLTMISALKSTMTLTIYEKNGATRVRTISMVSKTTGGTEKRLVRFVEPADVRGTAMLIVDNEDTQDEMWIYLPALKKTRRIVSTEKGEKLYEFRIFKCRHDHGGSFGLQDFSRTPVGYR